jgi:hypothetical protein
VLAQWTVPGFRTVSCNIIHQGEKNPGHPLRRPEDCGIEDEIAAINHINALYVINI